MQVNYNTGTLVDAPAARPSWSDMEWQLRNWLYFTWLSGDHNVEQHVHSLDKAAWAMHDEPPVKATGLGGRQVRTEPEYGNIFDHHAVVYEYANGVQLFAYCRQQAGCSDRRLRPRDGHQGHGRRDASTRSKGRDTWRYRGRSRNMYQDEHNELFASIRAGKPINNGEYMARSTMMAIMGRMATYTGQTLTWEEAIKSREWLGPPAYDWISLPVPPVAMPGHTPLV